MVNVTTGVLVGPVVANEPDPPGWPEDDWP
jgi:hypothetical protein